METTAIKTILSLSSSAFQQEDYIPKKYTCQGAGINPPLTIKGIPENTRCLALIMEDPDAPVNIYDHWIVWNIPPTDTIPENTIPGLEGTNSSGKIGYIGPCPPSGTHRYFFKMYAVDSLLEVEKGVVKSELLNVLQHRVLAYGELIGLYKK
jgi:Raf kinase inhibitor-like YbhB/YbcL family protein